jgi:hypothetical protein
MMTLREQGEALARNWETMTVIRADDHAVLVRCAAALRALLASPEATDPDERVKRGFRIGIAAAARHVAGFETGGGWHNVLAAEIRDLAAPALAPSIATRLGPHCTEGDEETLKAVDGALTENA